jgi:hypothetical protein
MPDVYFLCRLKINHDSHEFILEFGTVANNYAFVSYQQTMIRRSAVAR